MGFIYLIRNKVNNKVYIGKTMDTVVNRISGHLKDSKREIKREYPLYKAFEKYGVNNFEVVTLEECDNEHLSEREVYYINKYKAYENGYNQTLGGDGAPLYHLDDREVIEKYIELGSIAKVADYFKCGTFPIKRILNYNNVEITSRTNNSEVPIIQLDNTLSIVNIFPNKQAAYKYMLGAKPSLKRNTFYYYCKRACDSYGIAFGYYWIYKNENLEEALSIIRCNSNGKYSVKVEMPSKEELIKALENNDLNQEATGRYFGVTGTTIKRWLRKYDIIQ